MKFCAKYIGVLLSALSVVISVDAVAQIRIVPREKIDSIASPQTISADVMAIEGGDRLSFGEIAEEGGLWSRTIKWQNRGEKPLVITRLTSSCSCLRAESGREPVACGKWSSITLHYSPERRGGYVNQRVYIYTNLSDKLPTAVVTLSGRVKPSLDRSADYPFSKGELLLRRDTISIELGEQVRVACMNGGKQALRLRHNGLLTEQGVTMHTEPRVLQAGQEGDLIVSASATIARRGFVQMVIDGLSVPPRQRTVVVEIKD